MELKVSCGSFEVEYSGDEKFAKESLCALVADLRDIIQIEEEKPNLDKIQQNESKTDKTLPEFLEEMENKSERNSWEYRKFLVAAAWLHLNGKNRLQTADVASALLKDNFNKLSNPSDCLAKNIRYDHCRRVENNEFIVTQKGFKDLGLQLPS